MELKTNYCAITLPLVMLFVIIYQELEDMNGFSMSDFYPYSTRPIKTNSEVLDRISTFHLFF